MNRIFKKFFGWKCSSFDIYQENYYRLGGSVNTHPKTLRYLLDKKICEIHFYHYEENDIIQGCFFEINNKIGVNQWRNFPITSDEIILPINENKKLFLPGRSNKISSIHSKHIYNTIFTKFRPRKKFICLIKDEFSKKNHKKRKNEFNKFIKAGGGVLNLQMNYTQRYLLIYTYIFSKKDFRVK